MDAFLVTLYTLERAISGTRVLRKERSQKKREERRVDRPPISSTQSAPRDIIKVTFEEVRRALVEFSDLKPKLSGGHLNDAEPITLSGVFNPLVHQCTGRAYDISKENNEFYLFVSCDRGSLVWKHWTTLLEYCKALWRFRYWHLEPRKSSLWAAIASVKNANGYLLPDAQEWLCTPTFLWNTHPKLGKSVFWTLFRGGPKELFTDPGLFNYAKALGEVEMDFIAWFVMHSPQHQAAVGLWIRERAESVRGVPQAVSRPTSTAPAAPVAVKPHPVAQKAPRYVYAAEAKLFTASTFAGLGQLVWCKQVGHPVWPAVQLSRDHYLAISTKEMLKNFVDIIAGNTLTLCTHRGGKGVVKG